MLPQLGYDAAVDAGDKGTAKIHRQTIRLLMVEAL
jgi:hypothetical protein